MKWLKYLLIRAVAWFHGWLVSRPIPHRSLSAAASPPEEFDPCKDPFGDNLEQKSLEFNAALNALQEAAESYMNCRIQNNVAVSISSEWAESQFAAAATSANAVVAALIP